MKQKILYISDSTIPSYSANSINVMKMCQAWGTMEHDVTLLAKNTSASLKKIDNVHAFYGVKPVFKVKIFPFISFPYSGRFYNFLLPLFSFGNYDFVYTRAIYAAFWYSLFGRTIAFEIHEPFDTKSAWLKLLFKFIVGRKKVRKWVVISHALKTNLEKKHHIPASEILVAHDGADVFPSQVSELSLQGDFKIGYVGSLLKGKGVEIILPLARRLSGFTFHIVGGNSGQIEAIRNSADGVPGNLIFHGFKSPAETASYINAVDVLIAPYLKAVYVKNPDNSNNIADWMSPLKIFEYMSSGKPILTSDLPVLREVLSHEENALLCDPDNLPQWEETLQTMRSDAALCSRIAGRAKNDFLSKYTWLKRSEHILNAMSTE